MFPEISRRCRGCGASVRARARFCPQCGLDVGDKAVTETGGALKTETVREPVAPKEKAAEAVEAPEQRRRAPAVRALAGAAREKAEEQLGPRVEKIRQASNVVIDEAAEDPEVRFLLIAAVLFILFVVIFFVTTFFIK